MPRNIVLLSDGTGNSAAKLFKTNVWRLHGALDRSDPARQVAHYSDGIGTSSFKPLAILGGVFGFGLKRNVLDLYQFACRSYRPGDQIFGFGFSRGAFTIRIVAGLIAQQGLVTYRGDEAQLARDTLATYRVFRGRFNVTLGFVVTPFRRIRDRIAAGWRHLRGLPPFDPAALIPVDAIRFLGAWDTVSAYGGPIEEITRGIDYWLWPLSMPDRFMSAKVQRACHALALDDERNAFWPVLWDEHEVSVPGGRRPMQVGWAPPATPGLPAIDRQRMSQVWFAGMHSSVGGGYAQDGLSHVSLAWMMDRAEVYGLLFDRAERTRLIQMADGLDKLNDSRHGLSGYYRYKPRRLTDIYGLDPVKPTISGDIARMGRAMMRGAEPSSPGTVSPMIHESVFERIAAGLDGYAPIVLPADYRVTTRSGDVRPGVHEHPTQASTRAHLQERAWNRVWLRRVVYFTTVFASLFLAALPLIVLRWPGHGLESPAAALTPLIDGFAWFLPAMTAPWLAAFRAAPGRFALGVVTVSALLLWSGALQRRIGDVMLGIWRPVLAGPPHQVNPAPPPRDLLYRVRTAPVYRGSFYALTHWILPSLFAALIVYGTAAAASRVLFVAADSLGLICRGAPGGERFDIASLCHRIGETTVSAGRRYVVTLETDLPWRDGARAGGPAGLGGSQIGSGGNAETMSTLATLPFRRHLRESRLAVIVRVGVTGQDEQALRFDEPGRGCSRPAGPATCTASFTARSSGPVFVFVNDVVIGIPYLAGRFYADDQGRAIVRITAEP
ncbi:MAG TPA: DUF2235 domain-containing protein [Methylomirabilota bacterium]|nr:DUF2235 domain-containing protein [Methylomirabilota bacterium]